MIPTIKVGKNTMPSVGLGLWKTEKTVAAQTVVEAIEAGYRHLDSACDYGNEKEVGEGIRNAIANGLCNREDLWVTSKLWNTYHEPQRVKAACERTLADLQTDYLDLYLIHFPIALKYVDFDTRYPPEWFFDPDAANPKMASEAVGLHETWYAMERLVEVGLVKNIGVCNYNSALLHDLMAYSNIRPSMLQIESHPYLTQAALVRTAGTHGVPVTAFSPLGSLSYVELDGACNADSLLFNPTVIAAANRVKRTAAQVLLRWGVQRGTAIIPKTTVRERLKENLSLFDFELNTDEMAAISALNINRRFNDPGIFCESAFNTFYPIYD